MCVTTCIGRDGAIRLDGDSHFAFLVPEPAFEDTDLIAAMLQAGLITERFIACLAMTDFSNPVFSERRATLLRYVPEAASGANVGEDMQNRFVAALDAAIAEDRDGAAGPGSVEQEFLANWSEADFRTAFRRRIAEYFLALQDGASNADVVDGWFRLVEHRRRRFRDRRLAEFKLTTPRTNIPDDAPAVRMNVQGRVETISDRPIA